MLRCLFTNQQRSFHQSATRWNYSRTALRRLKKPELVALAGKHQLDSSGTKNDLIDRLLTTPTKQSTADNTTTTKAAMSAPPAQSEKASSTPSPTTTTTTSSNSNDTTTETSNVKPKVATAETPSSSSFSSNSNSSTPGAILSDSMENDNDDEFDKQWVEAFDLKVGNRRSGLERTSAKATRQLDQHNKPHRHRLSDVATSSSTHPAYVHQTVGVDPANNNSNNNNNNNPISMSAHRPTVDDVKPLDDEPMDPEINEHWVKVFDQRVKTRTKIIGLNTLDINPSIPLTPPPTIESTIPPTIESTPPKADFTNSTTGNKAVTTVVGTSLAAWYFLGADGIQATFSSFFS